MIDPAQPRLEIRHLMMILAIARTGSLTRSAEELAVTPSALSHRLSEAERRIGHPLCNREGRQVTLTPAGEMIRRSAEQALGLVAQAESDVERLQGGAFERALRLTVGHYGHYGHYDWFADFMGRWWADHQTVHVYIRADAQGDPGRRCVMGGWIRRFALSPARDGRGGLSAVRGRAFVHLRAG